MFQNLQAEMKRYGISTSDLSRVANKTKRSIQDKMRGKNDFTLSEAAKIRDSFFPGLSLEYLFARGENPERTQDSA